ncbi:hypothetical protein [Actibacterium sp. 188UL27-1]|uniref:hypothetical protein n=1 Tax=Actibacterium sp. 188UL27-1 TaxID=2786961 RepID=UPI00195F167A|nr:hypothetical protein [Actibacterium sp. 188UL27-1]MBM7069029.1 hypothetical protein [Actibacterium sp. 188UL27-1]
MISTPLTVVLNGSRSYVQGTQMLARAAEALSSSGDVALRQAVFQNITDHGVAMTVLGPSDTPPTDAIGRAQFADADGTQINVSFEKQPGIAPRGDIPAGCKWSLINGAGNHPLDAEYELAGLKTGEDVLVALIQTIKERHQTLAGDVTDIWFTGLRRADLQMAHFPAPDGTLKITYNRLMGQDGEYQTMQLVHFNGTSGHGFEAVVSFAFKSQDFTNVA